MNKEIDLVGTGSTDAQEWASEFMRIFGNKKQEIDEGLMIAWFANAIEVAKDSTPNRQQFEQSQYEDVLSAHWHKAHQLEELVDTNQNNSPLRLKSINDRQEELRRIINQKEVLEQLSEEILIVPDWYITRMKEVGYECN